VDVAALLGGEIEASAPARIFTVRRRCRRIPACASCSVETSPEPVSPRRLHLDAVDLDVPEPVSTLRLARSPPETRVASRCRRRASCRCAPDLDVAWPVSTLPSPRRLAMRTSPEPVSTLHSASMPLSAIARPVSTPTCRETPHADAA
jgi:hypothetical protein